MKGIGKSKASTNLLYRARMLEERAELIDSFAELGLKQTDIVERSGQLKGNVSGFFSGRNDSPVIETAMRELIEERTV